MTPPLRGRSYAGSEQAVHAVHFTTGDVQRLVMLADCLLVRPVEEAVTLAVGVVIELNLPYTELVGSSVPRSLGYLVDGFVWQLQVLVEIHESRHVVPPDHASRRNCAPVDGPLSIPAATSG